MRKSVDTTLTVAGSIAVLGFLVLAVAYAMGGSWKGMVVALGGFAVLVLALLIAAVAGLVALADLARRRGRQPGAASFK